LRQFDGTVSGLKVDNRQDSGPMGSCDGSVSTYCTQYPSSWFGDWKIPFPDSCTETSPTCDPTGPGCCKTTGTAELCDSTKCQTLPLGSTITIDGATNFSCGSRYRGPFCGLVPKTCRGAYKTCDQQKCAHGAPALIGYRGNGQDCGVGKFCGCSTVRTASMAHPPQGSYALINNQRCLEADISC
jgi:hypothetical protein